MSKWISVKKRLPKEKKHSLGGIAHSEEVLITIESDAFNHKHVEAAYLTGGKWMCVALDVLNAACISYTVTAWRPMPEPYEGDD